MSPDPEFIDRFGRSRGAERCFACRKWFKSERGYNVHLRMSVIHADLIRRMERLKW